MAQEKQFSKLDNLFDNGLTMNALPVGLAAGAGFGLWHVGQEQQAYC